MGKKVESVVEEGRQVSAGVGRDEAVAILRDENQVPEYQSGRDHRQ
jgi:hypothetical protein